MSVQQKQQPLYRFSKFNWYILGTMGLMGYFLTKYVISDVPYNDKLRMITLMGPFLGFPLVTVYAYHFKPFTFEPSTIFGLWITTWLFNDT
jgi:hypothetical protein